MTVPQDALLTVLDRQTTELLDYALAELWAADFNAESRLDGWTAGYVATYIAREADRMADHLLVSTARAVPPYDADRRWDLERGGLRPGAVLIDDLHESAARLQAAIGGVSDWSALDPRARDMPARRLLQVLVHGADLGRQWDAVSVDDAEVAVGVLPDILKAELDGVRLLSGGGNAPLTASWQTDGSVIIEGSPRALLAWTTGRSGDRTRDESLPEIPPRTWL